MRAGTVIYYKDELTDEFAEVRKDPVEVGADFVYIHKNVFWRAAAFVAYRLVMTPIAFLHGKIALRAKVVGAEKLKPYAKTGIFIYGNHTLQAGDAYIPNIVTFPKKTYVIVQSGNISAKGTKNFIMMNGALPIPTKLSGMRNFMNAIEKRILQGSAVMIYPEAHIWPYYTKIRPYKSVSFNYPVKFDAPVFCTTVTYQRRRRGDKPKITVYVDGPFFPTDGLGEKEKVKDLRDRVYAAMCERAKASDYEYVRYERKT